MHLIAEGKVIHAGTMNSSNSTVAAAIGTLEVLENENVVERVYLLGNLLMAGLKQIGKNIEAIFWCRVGAHAAHRFY